MEFDPRPWNLLAGVTLAACGPRIASTDDESSDSSVGNGESSDSSNPESSDSSTDDDDSSTTDSSTGDGDGEGDGDGDGDGDCVGVECPPGYYCYDGDCYYYDPCLGHCCQSTDECNILQICELSHCYGVDSLPQCNLDILPMALEIPDAPLALTFADVDADGAQELVVASETSLHVYDSGSPMPASHARGNASDVVTAMVGGTFESTAGDDLLLLHDETFDLHASDGLGTLSPAMSSPSPFPQTAGLEVGDFNGNASADLLAWGAFGGGLVLDGTPQVIDMELVYSASARDFGTPAAGLRLLKANTLDWYDLDGLPVGFSSLEGWESHAQSNCESVVPLDFVSYNFGGGVGWSLIEVFLTTNGGGFPDFTWGVVGSVTAMRNGDLDGLDDRDELAMIVDDGLVLHIGGDCLQSVPLDGAPLELNFGDHDGDGDDELAVRTANGVSLVDVED